MELYKLISTVKNTNPDTVFTFDYVPENFEGVKITQKFNFVNPIGYTPTFSIETMRVILDDKSAIDAIFLQYGMESEVEILIQKLNATGTGYDNLSTFAVDFETYEISDDYSEFALKSVSVIDYYNAVKNTEKQFTVANTAYFPTTQKYINYVSLKDDSIIINPDYNFNTYDLFQFQENNASKIYTSDASLMDVTVGGVNFERCAIYEFGATIARSQIQLNINVNSIFSLRFVGSYTLFLNLKLYSISTTGTITEIYTAYQSALLSEGRYDLTISVDAVNVDLGSGNFSAGDKLFLAYYTYAPGSNRPLLKWATGTCFIDITVLSDKKVVDSAVEPVKYIKNSEILQNIFNNQASLAIIPIMNYGITSANHIMKLNDFVNIKPKDFLTDLCAGGGLITNFKTNGTVQVAKIADYFNDLFTHTQTVTDYKELTIKYNQSINFASVTAGQEISEYDMFTYLVDWNKKLTFSQSGRNATENLDLSLQKIRGDFSGMLDYFYKRSKQTQKTSKDNFMFDPSFVAAEPQFYDHFTPREILLNWKKFLSFCFQNFGKDTLTISSNGGNTDNYVVAGVAQMDDIVLAESVHILPIEYNFTAVISGIDFSEKILKINHNGADVYLFVINAESTDQLTEQKITGLKIEF